MKRIRDPRDNPTEIIHRLIEEYKIVVNEYLLLRNFILQNPDVRAVDIPAPMIEYHELDQQIARRKVLNVGRSRANRKAVELSRLRTDRGHYLRVHTEPILRKIDELMEKPKLELTEEAKRELERPLTPEEERQLLFNETREATPPSKPDRATHTADGKKIIYPSDDYDPNADLHNIKPGKSLLDD